MNWRIVSYKTFGLRVSDSASSKKQKVSRGPKRLEPDLKSVDNYKLYLSNEALCIAVSQGATKSSKFEILYELIICTKILVIYFFKKKSIKHDYI